MRSLIKNKKGFLTGGPIGGFFALGMGLIMFTFILAGMVLGLAQMKSTSVVAADSVSTQILNNTQNGVNTFSQMSTVHWVMLGIGLMIAIIITAVAGVGLYSAGRK